MKRFRSRRREGNKPMDTATLAFVQASKEGPCMACLERHNRGLLDWQRVVHGCDWNHAKSGNIRRGHLDGFSLCVWHHRRHPLVDNNFGMTLTIYGPSLMDGGKVFAAAFGGDDYLIELQKQTTGELP